GGIDGGSAADGGGALGKQGRGPWHEADAAAENACGEAGKIADHAAAKSEDHIAALHAEAEQPLAGFSEHRETLALLSRRHHHLAEERLAEARLEPVEIECRHRGVAHNGATCPR